MRRVAADKLSYMLLIDRRVKPVWSGMVLIDVIRRGDPRSPGYLRPKRKYHRRKAIPSVKELLLSKHCRGASRWAVGDADPYGFY